MSSVVPGQRAAPAVQAAARLSVPGTAWQHAPLARGSPAAPLAGGRRRRAGGSRRRQAAPTQALLGGLAAVFKNDPAERTRKAYQPRVEQINALEPSMQQLSDEQLRELTAALQARAAKGEPLDSLLVESFAVSTTGGCSGREAPLVKQNRAAAMCMRLAHAGRWCVAAAAGSGSAASPGTPPLQKRPPAALVSL